MPDNYHVIFTRRAAADLEGIFKYIAHDSPRNASRVITKLVDAIDSLGQLPHRYRVIKQHHRIRDGIRMMPVSPYLLYYRVLDPQRAVRIITIRHGARKRPDVIE